MSLIIVDTDKFKEQINLSNDFIVKRLALLALNGAKQNGIDAVKQLIQQEKDANDKLLEEKECLIKQNEEYAEFIALADGIFNNG